MVHVFCKLSHRLYNCVKFRENTSEWYQSYGVDMNNGSTDRQTYRHLVGYVLRKLDKQGSFVSNSPHTNQSACVSKSHLNTLKCP